MLAFESRRGPTIRPPTQAQRHQQPNRRQRKNSVVADRHLEQIDKPRRFAAIDSLPLTLFPVSARVFIPIIPVRQLPGLPAFATRQIAFRPPRRPIADPHPTGRCRAKSPPRHLLSDSGLRESLGRPPKSGVSAVDASVAIKSAIATMHVRWTKAFVGQPVGAEKPNRDNRDSE